MNKVEHLLVCASEEASEIVKSISKALRFGTEDGYPGARNTNAEDIAQETTELLAIIELLRSEGIKIPIIGLPMAITDKKRKVVEWMEYAKKQGTLSV